MRIYKAKTIHKREICKDTFELELDLSPNHLDFKAGQYIWVQTASGTTKAFSIASAPSKGNLLKIAFRCGTSDYKKELLASKTVTIYGPFGFLELRDQAVFIVGGMGITPLISIIGETKQPIRLLYSNHSQETAPYLKELEIINPKCLFRRIAWKDIEEITQGLTKPTYYVFGPEEMVKHVAGLLFDHGVFENKIVFEEFTFTKESIKNQGVIDLIRDETFKFAVESAFNHIIITDLNGKIVFANKAASQMTGFSTAEMIGQTPRLWGGLMDKDFYKRLWDTIKNKQQVYVGEITNRHKDGTTYITKVKISPIILLSSERVGFIGTEEDITHEKEVDRMKTEFVTLASHQLRTPLTSINWNTEMLESGSMGKLNPKQKELLSEVHHSSQHMAILVNNLLNISRIESGRVKIDPVLTDMREFLCEIKTEIESRIHETHCQVTMELPKEKFPEIKIDKTLLRQVVLNLLDNAVSYSSAGRMGHVSLSLAIKENSYEVYVKDDGIGIPAKSCEHIFEKFFRADNAREAVSTGNGLGLYLVKQIMDSSGGGIAFTSSEKGTIFVITIPKSGMISKEGERTLSV